MHKEKKTKKRRKFRHRYAILKKELTEEEKKAETAKEEKHDRELLAKKAHVKVEEIQPTPEEEFNER